MSQWHNNQGNWNVPAQGQKANKQTGKRSKGSTAEKQRPFVIRLLGGFLRLIGWLIVLAVVLGLIAFAVLSLGDYS